jgi:hypothetical protein
MTRRADSDELRGAIGQELNVRILAGAVVGGIPDMMDLCTAAGADAGEAQPAHRVVAQHPLP